MRSSRLWLAAAVALLGTGMALVATGVLVGALFVPGVALTGLGLLVAAAGAGIAAGRDEDGAVRSGTRAEPSRVR